MLLIYVEIETTKQIILCDVSNKTALYKSETTRDCIL